MSFYITTPIYYVNGLPHLGTYYTTTIADILARYHRLFGEETLFLTGTDEHGQKIAEAAKARGIEPQQHVDELAAVFQQIWGRLNISHDIFMRTTFPYHKQVVQDSLQRLHDKGDIYFAEYEGWYSVSEEVFYTEKDLVSGKSPAGKDVQRVVEGNYFFRMSCYQQQLLDYIQANPEYIQPEGKRSEILGFLRSPLTDLCISRPKSRLSWGIPLPFDLQYVTYVWFDALLNYISAIGYGQGPERQSNFEKWWSHAVHLIGKDILTTHAVYWSTMLFAMDIPLPKTIFAHGWILNADGGKMSKSEGAVTSPVELSELIGGDMLRYYVARDMVFGNDGNYSNELLCARLNSELANNLGNLASRSIALIEKYFDGVVPASTAHLEATQRLRDLKKHVPSLVKQSIEQLAPQQAIGVLVDLLTKTNQYIDGIAPWKTVKEDKAAAGECLAAVLEVLSTVACLLSPVMPVKMEELAGMLGCTLADIPFAEAGTWGYLPPRKLVKVGGLFPRVEL